MSFCGINDVNIEAANRSKLNLSLTKHLDKDCTKDRIHLLK